MRLISVAVRRPRLRLRDQLLLLVTALVAATLVTSVVIATYVVRAIVQRQFEIRALTIARGVALDNRYAQWLGDVPTPGGPVQLEAERVRSGTNAQYVVVADTSGIRYSSPDPAAVGDRIRTDLTAVRTGGQLMTIDQEASGTSATGSVPLRAADGRIVGTVSVGLAMSRVNERVWTLTRQLVAGGSVSLLLGIGGAIALARRFRRTTHGLEPAELADLLRGQEAVLSGVRDGVVAVDPSGIVTACNSEAERLLGARPAGRPVRDAGLPEPVVALLTRDDAPVGETTVIGDNTVRATRLAVVRDGTDLGQVLVLRDHSDLDSIARELEATRALTDALRAQAHEHNNRIHAVSGMLGLGHVDEARDYLRELGGSTTVWGDRIADPYLAGLLTAKSAAASEAGVRLRLGDTTWVDGRLTQPLDCITVVGNLVDNGIRAAAGSGGAWVEITLASDGHALVVHVVDSGTGVPAGARDEIFQPGFTTRELARDGHGLGLGLARRTARRYRGDVLLADPGGSGTHGAVFSARLEDVVAAPTTAVLP
ncbi:two-component system CitB family sensor kinase [Kribbella aluminosa]|uniref:histidine kinase n=1 Tax=Kribbella aluminosa TaxID=416017 RepID=A0ABS4UW01_9ACTN|nr:ATP-binding protein [Kribbella aluminosa]MBP2355828.1 two-component system CitB family sensor kinase [Kribbella aluminosa]